MTSPNTRLGNLFVSRKHVHHHYTSSPFATPMPSIVNLVVMRSVWFFDGFILSWVYRKYLAWLPEWKLWGKFVISINPKWPPQTKMDITF